MPATSHSTLLLIDTGLLCAGVLAFAVVVIRWARSGAWRNPLEPLALPDDGPRLEHLVAVFAAYYALFYGLGTALVRAGQIDPTEAGSIGSHDWHLMRCADDFAKLVACVLIVLILCRHRPFVARDARVLGISGTIVVGCGAVLGLLPLAHLQHLTGQIVWLWLEPGAEQPVHPVLEAVETSAWGAGGLAQLTLGAVVVAPIAEELFFRGLLLQLIWRHLGHAWLAIAMSGVAFGLIHHPQPQAVLPMVTMGLVLGYVRVRYRSLSACALVHALFNARTMVYVLLSPELARNGW